MVNYKFHKISSVFPLMEKEEFNELVEDIKKNGLVEPIWLWQNQIIDGRNRYRACKEVGIEPRFSEWKGKGSLISFIVSLNLKRRHLTQSQAACVATDILPLYEQEAKERQKLSEGRGIKGSPLMDNLNVTGRADSFVAEDFKVARGYIAAAKAFKQNNPKIFETIKSGKITITQANRELKEAKREMQREKNAKLAQKTDPAQFKVKFSTILIDPPWDWSDEGDKNQLGRAKPNYSTMPFEKILKLPIDKLSDDNCHLYLWITNRSLPKGFKLIKEWGFRYITCLTWCKPSIGMGNYFRGSTEHILFAIKGSQKLKRKDMGTWFQAKRGEAHSEKPMEAYELIESCSYAPYLEMFARKKRKDWKSWGAEAK